MSVLARLFARPSARLSARLLGVFRTPLANRAAPLVDRAADTRLRPLGATS
ncbi:hypothetical protein OG562_02695 [Streptomyces sp. NBC_01275]|uniref:hypothetical protein n=1 Tax=Streptomyces sp. NBC_01275 TaxID=2903807 RepID=UPI002256B116|nr:hypothetical protein [Streptomyces sp. NBC_01275]MCX4759917.1 hypothetical protein [Streptomyces sp. NBC_01275]